MVSSPCFACAGTGERKKFSRAAPCKERALRHHAAFIQVSVPSSHLVVLFSITLDICTCAGTRTKEAARLQLPNPSTPTCVSHVVLPSHRLTPAACTLPPMRSSVWLSLSWPTSSPRNPQRAFAFKPLSTNVYYRAKAKININNAKTLQLVFRAALKLLVYKDIHTHTFITLVGDYRTPGCWRGAMLQGGLLNGM